MVQTHRSFAYTTECYAKRTLGYSSRDVTLAVPKLFFGYATGSNLFFPFSVGASAVLFPERPTAEVLFEKIARHRPTILVNVPTLVGRMVGHPAAAEQDLSCLRFATSAGEALPVPLYERWKRTFGVELLDGLGTAEMWHVFVTNRPGDVRPGTLGRVVEGFEISVRDDEGLVKPYAFVVPRQGSKLLEEELKAYALEHLQAYKHPRRVIVVDELPRTHLGKIDRGKLKESVS